MLLRRSKFHLFAFVQHRFGAKVRVGYDDTYPVFVKIFSLHIVISCIAGRDCLDLLRLDLSVSNVFPADLEISCCMIGMLRMAGGSSPCQCVIWRSLASH